MIRLFSVYYPTRLFLLFGVESAIVFASFVLAAFIRCGPDSLLVLEYENGFYKILAITLLTLVCLDSLDLYDVRTPQSGGDTYFRLVVVIGILALFLAGIGYMFPSFMLRDNTFLIGLLILTASLFGWRSTHACLLRLPYFRDRVHVLGEGDRARRLVEELRSRPELGMEVIGWTCGTSEVALGRDEVATGLTDSVTKKRADRVVVALDERRGTMPVRELLDLRLRGVDIREATTILERISGRIEVDGLYPSALVFAEGFRLRPGALLARRVVAILLAVMCLLLSLPLLPIIAVAIKITSPGPVLYRQKRTGLGGKIFLVNKFRSMQVGAESATGATWAGLGDSRTTKVGRVLRRFRLDELPQLWNVLKGDMGFVGPRPERPEFVESLSRQIPYYDVRHVIRPGITGWAQVRYRYGASLEDSKEKLKYDLYYIKNISLSLDLMIVLRSIKIVLQGRGAR